MSAAKLRQQLVLPSPNNTVLVVCYQHQAGGQLELVGHAFATAWDFNGGIFSSDLDQFLFKLLLTYICKDVLVG